MTLRTVLILVLAVVFGMAASFYVLGVVNRNREAAGERVDVIYTTREVPPGNRLTADMLAVKQVAKGDLIFEPQDPIGSIEEATRNGGRVTTVKLVKGDIVLKSKLANEGAKEGMSPLIRRGDSDKGEWLQAATILTPTPAAGVGGFIRPGDHVDVLLTVDHFTPEDRGGTVRLMQLVEVLAADNRLEANPTTVEGKVIDQRELRYVTLLVTPKQAQELALAQKHGTLTLILRNPDDNTEVSGEVVTAADLKLPSPPPKDAKKPDAVPAAKDTTPPPPPPIRLIRGGNEAAGSAP